MARRKKQPEDQSPENLQNTPGNSDDTFGLPEIEYEPINREEAPQQQEVVSHHTEHQPETHTTMEREEEVQQNAYDSGSASYYDDDEDRSPWPKILGITAVLLITGALIWYFGFYNPRKMKEKEDLAKKEQLEKDEAARRAEAERLENERRLAEQRKADSLANLKPAVGAIETLNERTGRYYVVVASAIDGDLIMDQAQKLSAKGVSSKIIPPFGKAKFYRLTVAEGDTYATTQETANTLKSDYSGGAWVIKY